MARASNLTVQLQSMKGDNEQDEEFRLCENAVRCAMSALADPSAVAGPVVASGNECSLGIVYGNSARLLTKDEQFIEDGHLHTHEWTLYVRPYRNTWHMSSVIRKVNCLWNRTKSNC